MRRISASAASAVASLYIGDSVACANPDQSQVDFSPTGD